jgi:predicted ArsR family transcriptional regulator
MSTRAQIAIQTADEAAPKMRTPREGTKQATLIAMLRAPDGATIEEIGAALQWAPHTIRGAMAGALKKKLGLKVSSEKVEDRGRVYKLPAT